jgi:hypothetical protein
MICVRLSYLLVIKTFSLLVFFNRIEVKDVVFSKDLKTFKFTLKIRFQDFTPLDIGNLTRCKNDKWKELSVYDKYIPK